MPNRNEAIAALPTEQDDSTYDHVLRYTGLFGGVQGLTMLFSIVRNKLAAYFLGTSGIGLVSMFSNAIHLVNQSTNLGLSFSAVKHVSELFGQGDLARIRDFCATVRVWCLLTALLGTCCALALSPMLSRWTFDSEAHILDFVLLSPVVGCLTVSGGELAILKGLKQLKKVALVSACSSLAALVVCTPLYWMWGVRSIVAVLLLTQAAALAINLHYSTKVMPWRLGGALRERLRDGRPMVMLGLGYIVAGVFGQGAEYVIRTLIYSFDGNSAGVGLYHSGYTLTVTYASVVFAAIEADFFPRLSAGCQTQERQNRIVNQQIEVSLLLIAPILILFVLAMPLAIWLLFNHDFLAAVPMATCATFFMLFKSVTLPVAYLPLAHGEARIYVLTEALYDVFIAAAVPFCYSRWGLQGAGCALALAGLEDLLFIHLFYRYHYGFRVAPRAVGLALAQFALFSVAEFCALQSDPWLRYTLGGVAFGLSLWLSLHVLGRETSILKKLRKRFRR